MFQRLMTRATVQRACLKWEGEAPAEPGTTAVRRTPDASSIECASGVRLTKARIRLDASLALPKRVRRDGASSPRYSWTLFVCLFAFLGTSNAAFAADWKFSIRLDPAVRQSPFTGRVYLFFNGANNDEPRLGPDWFHPEPFVALDVERWNPAEPLSISPGTARLLSFPRPLADLDLMNSRVQAVIRLNPYEREVGTGPGNGFSAQTAAAPAASAPGIDLLINQIVPEPVFKNSDRCQEIIVRSELLSTFHGREVLWKAAVQLPASYLTDPERRYPVILVVPGFGGDHYNVAAAPPVQEQNERGVEFIRVTLNPSCARGHHVFADSANNGPAGKSFVTEFLPQLDQKFRTVAAPTARFLTGHSSGGWSTLWLQTTYPEIFGGTWSTAPDSVDFHDFQRVDIYQPSANLFRDEAGNRRPLGRNGATILLWTDRFCDMEHVLGYGGQMQSFEAVFSPRGTDGAPLQIWDRRTGAINQSVAETWKRYDIRLRLLLNWPQLAPQLAGKLHVFMGAEDTFYLEGATRRLKATLTQLGSDAVVEIVPGKNHFNLFDEAIASRVRQEMVTSFLKHHQP